MLPFSTGFARSRSISPFPNWECSTYHRFEDTYYLDRFSLALISHYSGTSTTDLIQVHSTDQFLSAFLLLLFISSMLQAAETFHILSSVVLQFVVALCVDLRALSVF